MYIHLLRDHSINTLCKLQTNVILLYNVCYIIAQQYILPFKQTLSTPWPRVFPNLSTVSVYYTFSLPVEIFRKRLCILDISHNMATKRPNGNYYCSITILYFQLFPINIIWEKIYIDLLFWPFINQECDRIHLSCIRTERKFRILIYESAIYLVRQVSKHNKHKNCLFDKFLLEYNYD